MNEFSELGGVADFGAAVIEVFEAAVQEQARSILLADADLECWPLDNTRLLDALSGWVRLPGRRLGLYARSFDGVRRRHPRFTRWRLTYGHAVDAREPEDMAAEIPSLLVVDRSSALELRDRDLGLFMRYARAADVHRLRDSLEAQMQRGSPGFAQVVLGL